MKKLILALSIFVTGAFVACTNNTPDATAKEVTVEKAPVVANAVTNIKIEGMTCVMGCKGAIEKSLNATAGIDKCEIDFDNATAKVTFDNNLISEQQIIEEVEKVNNGAYTAALITALEATENEVEENTEA